MVTSIDAILCLGFKPGEETLPWWNTLDKDMEDWYSEAMGLKQPTSTDYQGPEWQQYFETRRQLVENCPIEAVIHYSAYYPMTILAIRGTVTRSGGGEPKEVLEPTFISAKVQDARAFCQKHNLPWQEPKWLLCCYWD